MVKSPGLTYIETDVNKFSHIFTGDLFPYRLAIKQAGLTACLACLIGNQASQQARGGPACPYLPA